MKKQKICIIGGSLTGLTTAIALSKLNCEIDLVTGNSGQNLKSNGTIAISENNFDFLKKLNISKTLKNKVWPCSIMKLYTESKNQKLSEVFELNNENKSSKIFYMLENSKITKLMINQIKRNKSISIKNNEKVSSITTSGSLKIVKFNQNSSYYNLVILCTGYNSALVKNIFNGQVIENSYKELAITTILNHRSLTNNIVRQIFLDNEILALLPISNTKTSVVLSVKKDMQKKNELLIKKKIKYYAKNYLRNIKFGTRVEYKNLNFLIRNKYYLDRTLLLGDALHMIHPFIGQGFNMTLRDLEYLQKILRTKINLGLDLGSSDVLCEFTSRIKPRNFIFSLGSDFLKNSISYKNLRNIMLKTFNKNNLIKDLFFNIANKGFKF